MPPVLDDILREQLLNRRDKLQNAVAESNHTARLHQLLEEVDAALIKMDDGSFGLCESCHERVECDRLLADPLVRFCLDHMSRAEQEALEQDLQLAARVQKGLLPPRNLIRHGWHVAYHYEPAGLVSGDYCDVIDGGEAGLYFMVGDVSGKGVAASMLTAHLHAMFRTLISVGLSLECMLQHASRVFSESTLPTQYATLVCGRALPNGTIQISNAGHPAPLIARDGEVVPLDGASLPIGMFCNEEFSVSEFQLTDGHGLLIYSDGISEAADISGAEYGSERLLKLIGSSFGDPAVLLSKCREDLIAFCAGSRPSDDRTLFILGRTGA
jgi:phosphoserine phosphatase RsbU/P